MYRILHRKCVAEYRRRWKVNKLRFCRGQPKADHSFRKGYEVQIPDRKSWNSNSLINRNGVPVFTDGSKKSCSDSLGLTESYRMPNECSVFQAEVLAIKKPAQLVIRMEIPQRGIALYVDSQAANKALASVEVKSKLVLNCQSWQTAIRYQSAGFPGTRGWRGTRKQMS